jgi:manganese/iron transport system permease protein
MFELLLQYKFLQRALISSILGGLTCGIVGVWVVLLNIPFVSVAMSHSAFAGAIIGLLVGIDPFFCAIMFCVITSLLIGPMAEKGNFSANVSTSVTFSFVLGIAFLGLGMLKGPKTDALNIMWGNILTVSDKGIFLLSIITIFIILFLTIFYKEIFAVIFNREIAKSCGISEQIIFFVLIFLCGMTVALNLNTIGGLLIFSLITTSPLAAYQITYNLKMMYILSSFFGIISCLSGLIISYIFNVPSGAVIIITSSIIFLLCMTFSPKRSLKK